MSSPTLAEAALAYAARGWHVLPLAPGEKVPLGRLAPHGCREASADPERIAAWWAGEPAAGVGIATGAVSGLVVVDLDGPGGEKSYGRLLSTHGPPGDERAPDGATVRTPGGGWHVYLRPPAGLAIGNSAGKLAPGIDVRGDGGYVVAPPSLHPEGGRYVWVDHPPAGPLPELASAWAALLAPPRAERPPVSPAPPAWSGDASGTRYGLAALRGELERLAAAPEGSRNAALNAAAFALGALAAGGELAEDAAAAALEAVALAIRLGPAETRATIASGLRAGRDAPRRAPERAA